MRTTTGNVVPPDQRRWQPRVACPPRFTEPISFSNGDSLSEFEFIKGSTFRAGYTRYKITNWRNQQYAVIG